MVALMQREKNIQTKSFYCFSFSSSFRSITQSLPFSDDEFQQFGFLTLIKTWQSNAAWLRDFSEELIRKRTKCNIFLFLVSDVRTQIL